MEKKNTYKDVLTQKEFLKMMIAALINRFGDSIDAVASTWVVYQLTNSAAWSALIFGINNLPTIVVTPFAGVWVEGKNKKKIMVVTDYIRAIVVASVASLFLLGLLQPWMLLVSNIIISTAEAFRTPADLAITPKVLDERLYDYGMSLHKSLSQIVQLVGAGCAAGIIAIVGVSGALYIDMTTFILSGLIIIFVNSKEHNLKKKKFVVSEYMSDFMDGIHYIRKESAIVFFLTYTVFLNAILVPINSLQAPLATEVLHSGVEILSIISVSFTVGMLCGSVSYPMVAEYIGRKTLFCISGLFFGLYYILLVVCQPLYGNRLVTDSLVACLSVIFGIFIGFCQCSISILFMKNVSKEYIARVGSIATSICVISLPVVSFIISGVVTVVSTQTIFLFAGIIDFIFVYYFSKKDVGEEQKNEVLMEA